MCRIGRMPSPSCPAHRRERLAGRRNVAPAAAPDARRLLAVVALAIDVPALAVLHMLDPRALAGAEAAAVGAAARLVIGDARLLAFEPGGLAGVELAAGDAARDPLL